MMRYRTIPDSYIAHDPLICRIVKHILAVRSVIVLISRRSQLIDQRNECIRQESATVEFPVQRT